MDVNEHAQLEMLIWTGQLRALSEQPIAPYFTWVNAVQTEYILFGADISLDFPRAPLPPSDKVAIVMMVKDENDIILYNLQWSYLIGVRRFAIIDNASSDGTWQTIRRFRNRFRDAEVVLVLDDIKRYMQGIKTTGLFRLAQSYWPQLEWVFAVDADEFLVPMMGFAPLAHVPGQAESIAIPKTWHLRGKTAGGSTPLDRMPFRRPLFCVPPNVAIRADPRLSVRQGNHQAEFGGQREATCVGGLQYGFYYREFPTRSAEHFIRKIKNGGRAVLAAKEYVGGSVGGEHWVMWYEEWKAGGDELIRKKYEEEWCKNGTEDGLIFDPLTVDYETLNGQHPRGCGAATRLKPFR